MNRQAAARLDALEARVSALETSTPDDTDPEPPAPEAPTERDTKATIESYLHGIGVYPAGPHTKAELLGLIEAQA